MIEKESDTWKQVEKYAREQIATDLGLLVSERTAHEDTQYTRGRIDALTELLEMGQPKLRRRYQMIEVIE